MKGVRGPFCVSLILLFGSSGLTALKALVIQPIVDGFLGDGATTGQLSLLCLVVIGIFWTQAAIEFGYAIIARMASATVVKRIREDLFNRLLGQSLGYFGKHPSSDLATRVVNDVAAFESAAVGAAQNLLRDLFTVTLLLAVMFYQQPSLAAVCLVVVFIAAFVLRRTVGAVGMMGRRVQESLSAVAHQITEMIRGIEVILGFGLANRWRGRFDTTNRDYYETQVRAQKVSATSVALVQLIVGAMVGIVLWLTGDSLLKGEITAGQFMSFLATLYLLQAPAAGIGQSATTMSRGMAAGARALELLDDPPELEYPGSSALRGAAAGGIHFRNVEFSYDTKLTIRNLSFDIDPGTLTVMVGDSGAGKSTVAKLAQRFYDVDSGSVLLGNVNLDQLTREDLFSITSYVAQDVFVFDETLEFNVAVGNPQATPEEISEALRIACLDEYVAELPDGIHTRIGEAGTRLSGGQRQRVAIARAVLAGTPILILDEATSALDMELEQRILQNLVSSRSDRTIFAITHRLTLAEVADRILVLREGEIVEQGTAQELRGRDGEYARLRRAAEAKLSR